MPQHNPNQLHQETDRRTDRWTHGPMLPILLSSIPLPQQTWKLAKSEQVSPYDQWVFATNHADAVDRLLIFFLEEGL